MISEFDMVSLSKIRIENSFKFTFKSNVSNLRAFP